MASGDTLLVLPASAGIPPNSGTGATPTRRGNDGHYVYAFDASSVEELDWETVLPAHYGGGGLTISLRWMAATAASGNVVWAAQIERYQDDTVDLDSDQFAAANTVTAGAPSASGEVGYDSITFTDGADMDSLAAGESFRLRVYRAATDGSDTMTGDAQLLTVHITET